MPFPQEQIDWLMANRARIIRWMFIPQLLIALLFLGFAYRTGRTHVRVLLRGVHAQGTIISVRPVRITTSSTSRSGVSSSSVIYLPLVEFMVQGRLIRFEEWKGTQSNSGVGSSVSVLYDPVEVSSAMLDRRMWNWLPWGPCFIIGAILFVAGLTGFLSLMRYAPTAV
jgi:hypothetical protein